MNIRKVIIALPIALILCFSAIFASGFMGEYLISTEQKTETSTEDMLPSNEFCGDSTLAAISTEVIMEDILVDTGASETADVYITDVTNLGSFSLNITWDPTVVNATAVASGDMITSSYIHYTNGYLNINGYSMTGMNGMITLATLTFEGIGDPGDTCPLTLYECELLSADPIPDIIDFVSTDGTAVIDGSVLTAEAYGPYDGVIDEAISLSSHATGGQAPYTYAWDLDEDGMYDDAIGQYPQGTWSIPGTYTIGLRVTDDLSDTAFDTAIVEVRNTSDFTVEKYVKWNCNGTYLHYISFDIDMVDWATYKIYVNTTSDFDLLSIKDTLPIGLFYLPGYSMVNNAPMEPTISGLNLFWNFTDVVADAYFKITFRVQIPDCSVFLNTVNVTGTGDGIYYFNTSQATMHVYGCGEPELTVNKYVRPESTGSYVQNLSFDINEYDWVTYKLVVNTLSAFDTISVTDYLPSGLNYISGFSTVNATPWEPNVVGDRLYWNLSTLSAGETIEILFRAEVLDCGSYLNIVNTSGALGLDTDAAVSEAVVHVTGCTDPEITVEKLVKWDCCGPYGSDITFDIHDHDWVTFKLDVSISDGFDSLVIRDTLPDGMQYISGYATVNGTSWEPEVSGQRLFWNMSFVSADESFEILFRAGVDDCGDFENWVNVTGSICDADYYAVDYATVEVTGCEEPEISIEKYVKWDCTPPFVKNVTASIGDYVTFKLYVNLSHQEQFNTITIRDTLPNGLTFDIGSTNIIGISVSNEEPTINGQVLTWVFEDLSDVSFVITFCANVTECGIHENQVNLTANICCGDYLYDTDTATVAVHCITDIGVDKQASLDGINWVDDAIETFVGDTVYFRINVSNNGDSILNGVSVVDVLPEFLEFNDDAIPVNGSYPGPGIRWFFPHIDVGEYYIITFSTTVIDFGIGYNVVDVYGCGGEPADSDMVEVIVTEGMHVEKQVSNHEGIWVDNITCMVGDTLRFKITLSYYNSDHNITLFDIVIKDILPEGLLYADSADPFEPDVVGDLLYWNFTGPEDYLMSGEQIIIEFNATVMSDGIWNNTVNVSAMECSGTQLFEEDIAIVNAEAGPSIDVIKWVQAANQSWVKEIPGSIGDTVHFNISISNIGTMPLYGIDVEDELPEGLEYINHSAELTYQNNTYDCDPTIIIPENNTLIWDNLNFYTGEYLSPSESMYLYFDARVTGSGILNNTVTVIACRCSQCTIVCDTDNATVNVTTGGNYAPEISNPDPADQAENVSYEHVELQVDISDLDGDDMNITFYNATDDSVIDTVTEASNGTVIGDWGDLSFNTTYSWYVTVSDGIVTVTSDTWEFSTGAEVTNHAPNAPTNPSPSNGMSGVSRSPVLSVFVSDEDDDELTIRFYNAANDQMIGSDVCTGDCTASVVWTGLTADTRYTWYVTVSDGIETVTSADWWFRTMLPDVDLDITIRGGLGTTVEIANTGVDAASQVSWSVDIISSGLFGRDWSESGIVSNIPGNDDVIAKKMTIFGIGRVTITVTADCDSISSPVTLERNAFLIGGYVLLR